MAKEKPKKAEEKPKKAVEAEELRHIVRILNTDLAGKKQVHMALTGIKGVGRRCARIFTDKAGVNPNDTLGILPDSEIDKLKKVIEEDAASILPVWMVNRRGDMNTGARQSGMEERRPEGDGHRRSTATPGALTRGTPRTRR